MFLVFALLLLSLWVGLFLSVFSAFFPFLQNIRSITDYNVAYYSALSAVERWSLVLKYRAPWFEWSWWVMEWTARGPLSDQGDFFVSGVNQGNRWSVTSRTTSIPNPGEGNVDPLLLAVDSKDYNALNYHALETILLSLDEVTNPGYYYSGDQHSGSFFDGGQMSWIMRLPPVVVDGFSPSPDLCFGDSSCDIDGDWIVDETMVNRKLQWNKSAASFVILPTANIFYYSGMLVNYPYDNAIRASTIDHFVAIDFDRFSPISNGTSLSWHTVVSSATGVETTLFRTILLWNEYTDLEISFGLVSLLRTLWWSIYPYIEYRFEFPQPVADRFFTLDGHGRNREYDVRIQIKKPTVEGLVWGDFTVVF